MHCDGIGKKKSEKERAACAHIDTRQSPQHDGFSLRHSEGHVLHPLLGNHVSQLHRVEHRRQLTDPAGAGAGAIGRAKINFRGRGRARTRVRTRATAMAMFGPTLVQGHG